MVKTKSRVMPTAGQELLQRWGIVWDVLGKAGLADKFIAEVNELAGAEAAMKARCMAAMCEGCREHWFLKDLKVTEGRHVHEKPNGHSYACKASKIRVLEQSDG